MKLLFFVSCVLACSLAQNDGTGFPTAKCPKGENSVLYCPQKAEPSCDNPKVHDLVPKLGLCGVPQCFCNVPTVRDVKTGTCVRIEDCKKN